MYHNIDRSFSQTSEIIESLQSKSGKSGKWMKVRYFRNLLTLVLTNPDLSFLENTVDPDQLASDEAN